ncbi:hypothetical protein GCM10010415_03740 [Streptomyces atrovirens]
MKSTPPAFCGEPPPHQVREAVGGEAVQGADAVAGPRVERPDSSPAVDGQLAGADAGDADGESGGEDQAVERVHGAAHHDTVLGDAFDAVGVRGVDQGDVAPVEGRVVRVGEGGALAGAPRYRGLRASAVDGSVTACATPAPA